MNHVIRYGNNAHSKKRWRYLSYSRVKLHDIVRLYSQQMHLVNRYRCLRVDRVYFQLCQKRLRLQELNLLLCLPQTKSIAAAIMRMTIRVKKRFLVFMEILLNCSGLWYPSCIGLAAGRICSASARRCLSLRYGWRFFGTTSLYKKVFTFATFRQYFKSSM